MDITIVTSARNDAEAQDLLKLMGFPLAEAKEAPAKPEAKAMPAKAAVGAIPETKPEAK